MEQDKCIATKYIDMVKRFQAIPNDRKNNVKRLKMIMAFTCWYRQHEDYLTDEEKEFLQNNIYRIKENDYYVNHA